MAASDSKTDSSALDPDSVAPVGSNAELWPGICPLGPAHASRLLGRDSEIDQLSQLFEKPESGQSPMVWLSGEAGAGKTSLVVAGLIPRLAREYGDGFEWIRLVPERGEPVVKIVESLAIEILKKASDSGDGAGLDLDGRLRQMSLLLEGDTTEAAEYLASCYRRDRSGQVSSGSGLEPCCLIFFDQVDRFGPRGDWIPGEDEVWLQENFKLLFTFLHDLTLTGTFPILAAVRSVNLSAMQSAAREFGLGDHGVHMGIQPPDPEAVMPFFKWAPAPSLPSGAIKIEDELLEFLSTTSEDGTISSEAIPFVSETLLRLAESDPMAEEFGIADLRWGDGVEQTFADVGEESVRRFEQYGGRDAFFDLIGKLHTQVMVEDRQEKTKPKSASLLELAEDQERLKLVEDLIDSRVLQLTGESPEQAEVGWSLPDGVRTWERVRNWLVENDELLERARQFDESRLKWESEERTPVCLLHGTRALDDARRLLDYHRRRPLLSEELIVFLEESVSFDQRLEGGPGKDHRLRLRRGILVGSLAAVVTILLIWFFLSGGEGISEEPTETAELSRVTATN